jgi:hypothetical protein
MNNYKTGDTVFVVVHKKGSYIPTVDECVVIGYSREYSNSLYDLQSKLDNEIHRYIGESLLSKDRSKIVEQHKNVIKNTIEALKKSIKTEQLRIEFAQQAIQKFSNDLDSVINYTKENNINIDINNE